MVDTTRSIEEEISQALNFLASAGPYANTVLSGEVTDTLIQTSGASVTSRGILYNIISKPVGPNTFKITIEDWYESK